MKDYFYLQVGNNVRLVLPADLAIETIALNWKQICPIPGLSDPFLGAIDYRGQLVWAIDLGEYLSELLGLLPLHLGQENSLTKDNLTGVAISAQPSNSKTDMTSQPVVWVVSQVYGEVPLNPARFRRLPTQFKSLLGPYFSGLTELDPNSEASDRTTVAILNMNGLFAALEFHRNQVVATLASQSSGASQFCN